MSQPTSDELIVETTSGLYRGLHLGSTSVWRGMRYAAAPIGANRWRRAVPVTEHAGVVDADCFGAICPQRRHPIVGLGPDVVMDEDCLFLNVTAPAAAADSLRPVMVWVHGGAYVYGSGSQPLYDGGALAESAGIIVVTLNYRIGAFGFADLRSVIDGAHSNVALADVLAALRWVRANIAAFGGDPGRVTVAGESAGGAMVTTLLTMPAAAGLFARAIAQSAPASAVYSASRMSEVATRLEQAARDDGLSGGIRDATSAQVVELEMKVFADVPQENPGILAFCPVVDGDLVPRHPLDVYRDGSALAVPVLIGTNRDEAAAFRYMRSPLMPVDSEQIRKMFHQMAIERPEVQIPAPDRIAAHYSSHAKAAGLGIARDLAFRLPTLWLAQAHAQNNPVYLYRFDWAPPMFRVLRLGATHGTELNYMFGNVAIGPREITYRLGGRRRAAQISGRMLARWGNFVAGGNPVAPHAAAPAWPAYTAAARESLVIGATDEIVAGLDDAMVDTWGEEILSFR